MELDTIYVALGIFPRKKAFCKCPALFPVCFISWLRSAPVLPFCKLNLAELIQPVYPLGTCVSSSPWRAQFKAFTILFDKQAVVFFTVTQNRSGPDGPVFLRIAVFLKSAAFLSQRPSV